MLVPSTFTGWYKKIMMKAEIANEMTRSRSHTAKTGTLRAGAETSGAETGVVATAPSTSGIKVIVVRTEFTRMSKGLTPNPCDHFDGFS
jgi:hypothetical protein